MAEYQEWTDSKSNKYQKNTSNMRTLTVNKLDTRSIINTYYKIAAKVPER